MKTKLRILSSLLVVVVLVGCGLDSDSGPFGTPRASPLMAPLAGKWTFALDKTLDAQKQAGATDEQIAMSRKFHESNPVFGKMHPDMTFEGDQAVGAGLLSSEYRFFGMHTHGSKLCGKAWHHEDRHDPGDMSKCHVRLEVVKGDLYMEVYMQDGLPDLDDPDLRSEPPTEGDAAQCDIDTKASQKPRDWMTYVFTRQ